MHRRNLGLPTGWLGFRRSRIRPSDFMGRERTGKAKGVESFPSVGSHQGYFREAPRASAVKLVYGRSSEEGRATTEKTSRQLKRENWREDLISASKRTESRKLGYCYEKLAARQSNAPERETPHCQNKRSHTPATLETCNTTKRVSEVFSGEPQGLRNRGRKKTSPDGSRRLTGKTKKTTMCLSRMLQLASLRKSLVMRHISR